MEIERTESSKKAWNYVEDNVFVNCYLHDSVYLVYAFITSVRVKMLCIWQHSPASVVAARAPNLLLPTTGVSPAISESLLAPRPHSRPPRMGESRGARGEWGGCDEEEVDELKEDGEGRVRRMGWGEDRNPFHEIKVSCSFDIRRWLDRALFVRFVLSPFPLFFFFVSY